MTVQNKTNSQNDNVNNQSATSESKIFYSLIQLENIKFLICVSHTQNTFNEYLMRLFVVSSYTFFSKMRHTKHCDPKKKRYFHIQYLQHKPGLNTPIINPYRFMKKKKENLLRTHAEIKRLEFDPIRLFIQIMFNSNAYNAL